jgi:hypothetical protein
MTPQELELFLDEILCSYDESMAGCRPEAYGGYDARPDLRQELITKLTPLLGKAQWERDAAENDRQWQTAFKPAWDALPKPDNWMAPSDGEPM